MGKKRWAVSDLAYNSRLSLYLAQCLEAWTGSPTAVTFKENSILIINYVPYTLRCGYLVERARFRLKTCFKSSFPRCFFSNITVSRKDKYLNLLHDLTFLPTKFHFQSNHCLQYSVPLSFGCVQHRAERSCSNHFLAVSTVVVHWEARSRMRPPSPINEDSPMHFHSKRRPTYIATV